MLLWANVHDEKKKKKRTWKKAIPKEIPAMIPRLASITLVTSVKQPYTADKHKTQRAPSFQNKPTSGWARQPRTHRRVHLFLSLVEVFQGLLWTFGVVPAAADGDALLFKVSCVVPVGVIFHSAAMQLHEKRVHWIFAIWTWQSGVWDHELNWFRGRWFR